MPLAKILDDHFDNGSVLALTLSVIQYVHHVSSNAMHKIIGGKYNRLRGSRRDTLSRNRPDDASVWRHRVDGCRP
jgi:hypothetical protein